MLLVDYRKSECLETHIVFDQGVSADGYPYGPVFKSGVDLTPCGDTRGPGQQDSLDSGRGKILADVCKVLLGKYFRRGHNAGLIAVSYGE